jgi:hypothetical protein
MRANRVQQTCLALWFEHHDCHYSQNYCNNHRGSQDGPWIIRGRVCVLKLHERGSATLSQLLTVEISCNKPCTTTALYTILTVCYSRVSIRYGESDEHADEGPKDKREGKLVCCYRKWTRWMSWTMEWELLRSAVITLLKYRRSRSSIKIKIRCGEASRLVFNHVRTFLVQTVVTLSSERWKGSCLHCWKTRCRNGCQPLVMWRVKTIISLHNHQHNLGGEKGITSQ